MPHTNDLDAADSPDGGSPRGTRRSRKPAGEGDRGAEMSPLRKPVNTLALVPKSQKITSLARKSWNVLLHEAQSQGLDRQTFSAPLSRIIRGVDFESNDHALIKKHLRAMVSTTVEWQSPTRSRKRPPPWSATATRPWSIPSRADVS